MKFMHLADLHFGRSLMEFDLQEDQHFMIDQIIDQAVRRGIDAVLIAGDVYDRANPGDGAMNLLSELLQRLSEAGKTVFLISGNHDSDDKLNFGRHFFEKQSVYIYSVFDGTLHRHTMKDELGEVDIWLLPFVKASQVRHFYPEEKIDTYEDAVRVVLEHAEIDPARRNVLAAHQFVAGRGGADPKTAGSESPAVKNVGNVERIGYDLFEKFDYAALGHIHSPQRVGREEVRYAGSPLKYSLSEVNDVKSIPIIELGRKGETTIELAPVTPLRDLRHIRGTKEQLLNPVNITDPQDFLHVTLTDEEVLDDAMSIFQQFYPNTLRIDYDNSRTRKLIEPETFKAEEEKSFEELITEFYRKMYDSEMTEQELAMLMAAAKEAGIEYEA